MCYYVYYQLYDVYTYRCAAEVLHARVRVPLPTSCARLAPPSKVFQPDAVCFGTPRVQPYSYYSYNSCYSYYSYYSYYIYIYIYNSYYSHNSYTLRLHRSAASELSPFIHDYIYIYIRICIYIYIYVNMYVYIYIYIYLFSGKSNKNKYFVGGAADVYTRRRMSCS